MFRLFTLAATLAALFSGAAIAQSVTGAILGTIVDAARLGVGGAKVAVEATATGAARQASADEAGRFYFGSLPAGEYVLRAEAQGFKKLEKRAIQLTSGETLSLGEVMLEIGSVTESIEITAESAVVQSASAERSGVITGSQVEHMAIMGRNVTSLLSLLPGVVDHGEEERLVSNWNINVQGNRNNTNNVSLNGAALNAAGNNNNSVINVSMDAVAEVKVLLSNYQAEYGRMSGANVQMVTKSGTRAFHGLASYFKRHEQFNANNFFNNQIGRNKDRWRFNTWNYNIGGPISIPKLFNRRREKLFFFWSQEFWPSAVSSLTQLTVPTALERAGDFSQTLDVNNRIITVNDPFNNKQPFPGNIVPANRIDGNGQALLKIFPLPNFLDRNVSRGNYNYVFANERETPIRTETLKTDYHIDSGNMLTANYTHRRDATRGVIPTGGNWDRLRNLNLNDGRLIVVQYRRILSPTLISETSAGYSWRPWIHYPDAEDLKKNQRDTVGYSLKQFNPANNPLNLVPQATFGGVTSPANLNLEGRFPLTTDHDIFTVSNNVSKVAGSHTVKAGIYVDRVWAYNQNGVMFNGLFDFGRNVNNPVDTNYAYSNAALGVFNSYTEASSRPLPTSWMSNIEWFAQDNWRVTRRLTLDFGVRFYLVTPSYIEGDLLSTFNASRWDATKQVRLIQPAMSGNRRVGTDPATGRMYATELIGAIVPDSGDPVNGMVVPAFDKSYPRALIENRGVHFGPRFGFAYDLTGKGRTAVRGGFGMFYNRTAQGSILYAYAEQPPMVQTPIIYSGTMSTLLGSAGYLFPSDILGLEGSGKVPTTMNYSLSVQRNIGFGTVVDVGYVGSLGRHLLWQKNLNSIPFGTNFDPANIDRTTGRVYAASFLRRYPGYNNINFREWASTSNYNSMQVTVNRRFARRLQYGAAWTWSKAMDFVDADTTAVSTQVPVRVWNYGLAGFDRTHILKVNWLWDVPRSPWKTPVLKTVFNDWQTSGIASFVSGSPMGVSYSLVSGADVTGSPTDGARVVVTGDPVLPKGERTFDRFLRTEVFRAPAIGTVGNSAKTVFRGPGINNWDLAVYKNFPMLEKVKVQFRWELYNAFNHTQFSGLDTAARFDAAGAQVNTRFGQMTAARAPRRMQFALRASF